MVTQATAPALTGNLRWMDPALGYIKRYLPLDAVARQIASAVEKTRRELAREMLNAKKTAAKVPTAQRTRLRAAGTRTDFDEVVARLAWFLVHGLIEDPVIAVDRKRGGSWSPAAMRLLRKAAAERLDGLLADQGLGGKVSPAARKRMADYAMLPFNLYGTRAMKMPWAVETRIRFELETDAELGSLTRPVSDAMEAQLLAVPRVLDIDVRYTDQTIAIDPSVRAELERLAKKKRLSAGERRRFQKLRTKMLSKLSKSGPQSGRLQVQVDDAGRMYTDKSPPGKRYDEHYVWRIVASSRHETNSGVLSGYSWSVFVGLDLMAP